MATLLTQDLAGLNILKHGQHVGLHFLKDVLAVFALEWALIICIVFSEVASMFLSRFIQLVMSSFCFIQPEVGTLLFLGQGSIGLFQLGLEIFGFLLEHVSGSHVLLPFSPGFFEPLSNSNICL